MQTVKQITFRTGSSSTSSFCGPWLTLVFFMAAGMGFFPQNLAAAPAYVQSNSAVPQSTPPATPLTVTVPFSSVQKAGDLNVVIVGWADSTNVVSAVTDSLHNLYQLAIGPTILSGSLSQSIYYAKNIIAGSNTVSVTFGASVAYPDIRILEYSGLDPSTPLDVAKGASSSSGTSSSSGAFT